MRRLTMISLAVAVAVLATSGTAQRNPRSDVEGRGTVRPSPENFPEHLRMRNGAFAAWGSDRDKRMTSYSYRMALRFAECVARFDREAARRILIAPIGAREDGRLLRRMAQVNHGCAVEQRMVHPLLLRAALAETMLDRGSAAAPSTRGALVPAIGVPVIGVPETVDGYPLAAISRCQVASAPGLVAALLATEPGERDEHDAVANLFDRTAVCGAAKPGRLTPTAARMGLIDAAYRQSWVTGARR